MDGVVDLGFNRAAVLGLEAQVELEHVCRDEAINTQFDGFAITQKLCPGDLEVSPAFLALAQWQLALLQVKLLATIFAAPVDVGTGERVVLRLGGRGGIKNLGEAHNEVILIRLQPCGQVDGLAGESHTIKSAA